MLALLREQRALSRHRVPQERARLQPSHDPGGEARQDQVRTDGSRSPTGRDGLPAGSSPRRPGLAATGAGAEPAATEAEDPGDADRVAARRPEGRAAAPDRRGCAVGRSLDPRTDCRRLRGASQCPALDRAGLPAGIRHGLDRCSQAGPTSCSAGCRAPGSPPSSITWPKGWRCRRRSSTGWSIAPMASRCLPRSSPGRWSTRSRCSRWRTVASTLRCR